MYERADLHLEVEGKVYVILYTSKEILQMFSSSCKPAAFYTESHSEDSCSHKKNVARHIWGFFKGHS